jgi:hypothetical protein
LPSPAPLRFAARALLLTLLCPGLALGVAAWPTAAMAQEDPYKLHMENGVKLFHDGNFVAARAEFQAAYDARPNANPLVNVALCEKGLFHYKKAIAALEKALDRHAGTMDPADKKAAEDAIVEMRGLLGTVTVTLTPKDATLVVDGEEQPGGAADKPIRLDPGDHKIAAKAPGFLPGEQHVAVASAQQHEVRIALVAEQGDVTVEAADPRMTISIDDRVMGTGTWAGTLPAGPHVVKIFGQGGPPFETAIEVARDKPVDVRPPAPKKDELPLRRGVYVLGTGSLLFAIDHPPDFKTPHTDFGAAFGGRVGFQVNNTAGFDVSYEHSSITTYQAGNNDETASIRILSDRVAASLRLISPGKMWRFVGTLGGGFVVDGMQFGMDSYNATVCTPPSGKACPWAPTTKNGAPPNVLGVDAYGLVELGAELDIDKVLIDLGVEAQFESTGNITPSTQTSTPSMLGGSIYGTRPIINVGPAIRIGYRFW